MVELWNKGLLQTATPKFGFNLNQSTFNHWWMGKTLCFRDFTKQSGSISTQRQKILSLRLIRRLSCRWGFSRGFMWHILQLLSWLNYRYPLIKTLLHSFNGQSNTSLLGFVSTQICVVWTHSKTKYVREKRRSEIRWQVKLCGCFETQGT